MKTESTNIEEPPIFIVRGKNWTCSVPVNLFNRQFPDQMIAEECGTQAIEQFMGRDKNLSIVLDAGEKELELGGGILIFKKDSDPSKGFLVLTHSLLANGAFYKQSYDIEQKTREFLEQSEKSEKKVVQPPKKPRKPRQKPAHKTDKHPKKPRKKKP
jgi:hypothetical protein